MNNKVLWVIGLISIGLGFNSMGDIFGALSAKQDAQAICELQRSADSCFQILNR